MMPRIFLFLIMGALPLAAQSESQQAVAQRAQTQQPGVHNGGKLNPDQVPGGEPTAPPSAPIYQPGVNPNTPPPGPAPVLPEMPAEPVITPKIAQFIVQPGTIREILLSKYQLATIIHLNVPAIKDMVCHVVSSDPIMAVATDIKFLKGQTTAYGGIQVNWRNIKHDGKVEFKAYYVDFPDEIFQGRLYIKKADRGPAPDP